MSIYGRIFAAFYDRSLAATEEAGLREARRELLKQARGRVLEIGSGTGVNIDLYPSEGIEELVLTEPEAPMAAKLEEKLGRRVPTPVVVNAPAEKLPFPDASFDTVVATLVLCTVGDLDASLAEARRVLKPGGRLLFLEHVRSSDPGVAKWQDRLHRPWRAIGHGCNCNRDTLAAIEDGAFEVETVEHGRVPKAPKIVRPLITGTATPR